jgi:hypothetical protein
MVLRIRNLHGLMQYHQRYLVARFYAIVIHIPRLHSLMQYHQCSFSCMVLRSSNPYFLTAWSYAVSLMFMSCPIIRSSHPCLSVAWPYATTIHIFYTSLPSIS